MMRTYATRLGVPVVLAAMLGAVVVEYRAGAPEAVDGRLTSQVEAFETREWHRPALGAGETSSGNAYRAALAAIDDTAFNLDERPFGTEGSVTQDVRQRRLTEASRRIVEMKPVQARLRALIEAQSRRWSWAGDDLSQYVSHRASPEIGEGASIPGDVPEVFRNVRLMTADALRQGGGACLEQLAKMARFLQDATVGAPTLSAATRSAGLGNLRYAVPVCAAGADLDGLRRAREMFELLVKHPVPMGASLEAQVLTAGLTLRSSVDDARPLPTSLDQVTLLYTAPRLWRSLGRALDVIGTVEAVRPTDYPAGAEAVDAFGDKLDTPSSALISTMVMRRVLTKDQVSQNMLRASLVTVAHYQRIAQGDTSPEPPEVIDSEMVNDAVTGNPMTWRLSDTGGAEVCFSADARDGEPICWQLPAWRGRTPTGQ